MTLQELKINTSQTSRKIIKRHEMVGRDQDMNPSDQEQTVREKTIILDTLAGQTLKELLGIVNV